MTSMGSGAAESCPGAAIFKENKILLVRESNGKWSLPGGWVDVDVCLQDLQSVYSLHCDWRRISAKFRDYREQIFWFE